MELYFFYHRSYKNRRVLFYRLDKEEFRGTLLPSRKKMEYYKIPFFETFNFLMIRLNSALYQIVLNNTNV